MLGSQSLGAETKLPPGAGAEITNCGSFLFIKELKRKFKKILVAEEVFGNCYNLILLG